MADHPLQALFYDPVMDLLDRAGLASRRRRLVAEARGRVLDVGGGTGRNLGLYRDVEMVVVLEPDASMRKRLLERVASAAVPVEVHEAGIEESGLPDAFFDTVVASLLLCSVDDAARAMAEIRRLLKPGGRFLFLEHVRAAGWAGQLQALATPVWSRLSGGCHLDRPTLDTIRRAGLAVTDCDRWGVLVQGAARPAHRPAGAVA